MPSEAGPSLARYIGECKAIRDGLSRHIVELESKQEEAMPSRTKKQAAAMQAAAAGKSTLGIPKRVGQDFVKADKAKGRSTGGKRK